VALFVALFEWLALFGAFSILWPNVKVLAQVARK